MSEENAKEKLQEEKINLSPVTFTSDGTRRDFFNDTGLGDEMIKAVVPDIGKFQFKRGGGKDIMILN